MIGRNQKLENANCARETGKFRRGKKINKLNRKENERTGLLSKYRRLIVLRFFFFFVYFCIIPYEHLYSCTPLYEFSYAYNHRTIYSY